MKHLLQIIFSEDVLKEIQKCKCIILQWNEYKCIMSIIAHLNFIFFYILS